MLQQPRAYPQGAPYTTTRNPTQQGWRTIAYPLQDPLRTQPDRLKKPMDWPADTPPDLLASNMQQGSIACSQADKVLDSSGQQSDKLPLLDLARAAHLAMCHNPQMRSSWMSIAQQAAVLGQARSAWLPQLNISVTHQRSELRYSGMPSAPQSTRSTSQSVNVSWRLFDFGTRYNRQKAADWQLQASLAEQDATLKKTLAQVVQVYTDAQIAQAQHQSQQEILVLAQQSLQTAKRRQSQGAGNNQEVLQSISAVARANLERSKAQGEFKKAQAMLSALTGLPGGTFYRVASLNDAALDAELFGLADESTATQKGGSEKTLKTKTASLSKGALNERDRLMQKTLHEWLQDAQARHPAIAAARANLKAAQANVKTIQSEGLPTVDASFNHYRNGRPNQALTNVQSRENVVGITLTIPVFDGFNSTYKVRQAQAQEELKKIELESVEQQTLMEITQAHAEAQAAWNNLHAANGLYLAAHEMALSTKRLFDSGAADGVQLNQAFANLAQAQAERSKAQAEWTKARLRLWVMGG